MKYLMYALLLLAPLAANSAEPASISPIGVEARCYATGGYGTRSRLQVLKNGREFYLSSPYVHSPNGTCEKHMEQINVLINSAIVQGRQLDFTLNDDPKRDFSVSTRIDGNAPQRPISVAGNHVSASGLRARCYATGDFGTRKRLQVTKDGLEIYLSSTYTGNGCESDAEKVRNVLNSARAVGKMVEFRHSDSPAKDFNLSSHSDPNGPVARLREDKPVEESGLVETGTAL